MTVVLDASALLDVVLDQPAAEAVLSHLGQPVVAPAHQLAEVVSAVGRFVRARQITERVARQAVEEAAALEQELVVPSPAHLHRALALQGRIRVLDGLYVALAEARACPLLTTDRRLAAADLPCEVILAAP